MTEITKLNSPEHLPPVGCWLLINIPGYKNLIKAQRTSYLQKKTHEMEYITEFGMKITGRYRWTYP